MCGLGPCYGPNNGLNAQVGLHDSNCTLGFSTNLNNSLIKFIVNKVNYNVIIFSNMNYCYNFSRNTNLNIFKDGKN